MVENLIPSTKEKIFFQTIARWKIKFSPALRLQLQFRLFNKTADYFKEKFQRELKNWIHDKPTDYFKGKFQRDLKNRNHEEDKTEFFEGNRNHDKNQQLFQKELSK